MAWPPDGVLPAGWTYFESDVYDTILASAPAVAIDATQYHLEAPSVRIERTSSLSDGGGLYASFGPITTASATAISIKARQAINPEGMRTDLYVMQSPGDFSQTYFQQGAILNNTGGWAVLTGSIPVGTWYVCIGAWRGALQNINDQRIWIDEPVGFGVAAASAVASVAWPVEVVAPDYVVSGWPVTVAAAPEVHIAAPWAVSVSAAATIEAAWPVAVLNADVVGGLDGAGAWAAAPGGQWEAIVTLGGIDISDRLGGDCVVQIAANAARTASFAFLPATTVAPMGLIGQRVFIAFAQRGRQAVQAIFAGVVDVPEVDLVTGQVACRCTDQAQEVWAQMPRASIDALVGGRWHVAISGEPGDSYDYMEARRSAVAASWALDVQQQPRILPWRSPARTLTVRAADIISDVGLVVGMPSRDQLRTRVVCRLQYRYPLLRYRGISAQYRQPLSFFLPWYRTGSLETVREPTLWLTRAMIEGAASGLGGWDLVGQVRIEHPKPGSYITTRPFLDPIIKATALTTGAVYTIPPSVAGDLCVGFAATYATRWQQSITEDYALTVVWGALESQLGAAVQEEIGATLEAQFDQPEWGTDASVAPALGAGTGDAKMPWQPAGTDAAARDEVLRVLLDQAWVRLWGASRTGRVQFAVPCRPDLWLDTAILIDHPQLRAAGDIVEVEHALNMESGSAITSVTVAVGMPGNTGAPHPIWTLPAPPVDTYTPPLSAFSCEIGTYVGGSPASQAWDQDTMIGFSTNHDVDRIDSEYYPHQLRIKSPPLAAEDRDPRDLPVSAEIAVTVPTDILEVL